MRLATLGEMNALRFNRDGSQRLRLYLGHDDYKTLDRAGLMRELSEVFGARFSAEQSDPLGDSRWVPFTAMGFPFELAWDHWVGWDLVALHGDGEATLRAIARHLGGPDIMA